MQRAPAPTGTRRAGRAGGHPSADRAGRRHADQVILDAGTKALSREGDPERGYGGIAGRKAVLAKLNEYHGFLAVPAGEPSLGIGTVVPVVPNHVCPVVLNFEELIVTDSAGASLQRWPVAARGFLS